jgi:hypothetical protein
MRRRFLAWLSRKGKKDAARRSQLRLHEGPVKVWESPFDTLNGVITSAPKQNNGEVL